MLFSEMFRRMRAVENGVGPNYDGRQRFHAYSGHDATGNFLEKIFLNFDYEYSNIFVLNFDKSCKAKKILFENLIKFLHALDNWFQILQKKKTGFKKLISKKFSILPSVAGLLNAFGYHNEPFPHFGTLLLVELHKKPNSSEHATVRVFYRNETDIDTLWELDIQVDKFSTFSTSCLNIGLSRAVHFGSAGTNFSTSDDQPAGADQRLDISIFYYLNLSI